MAVGCFPRYIKASRLIKIGFMEHAIQGTTSKTILGCIADDYTGATDLAGLLARSGVPVSLRMGVPKSDPTNVSGAEIEVIALKCRNAPRQAAIDETLAALRWLQGIGARQFFWKYCSTFDSTAKGNIGPVAEALMAALGTKQTIYCPAFPENGRSVYMGNLFIGEQPLAESPMKDHPLTPMRDSNLIRLLEPQVSAKVGLANRLVVARGVSALRERMADLHAQSVAHVVVDAVSNADLETIATACHDMPLLTGGSAIAAPLPGLYLGDGTLNPAAKNTKPPKIDAGSIVLSGSCSSMTQKQVEAYLKIAKGFRIDPILIAKNGLGTAQKWLAEQDPNTAKIIYATATPNEVRKAQDTLGIAAASDITEAALASLALQARNQGMCRFVVAGGETSGAITQALGVDTMAIGREIVPGVPWMYCVSGGENIALTLKSGNFGGVDFFTQAFEELEKL